MKMIKNCEHLRTVRIKSRGLRRPSHVTKDAYHPLEYK
jgi:hypothetical protein